MIRRLASNAVVVRAAVLAALPELVQQWLPGGEQHGDEYVALNPLRDDRNLGSFRTNTRTGRWRDHANGVGGGDGISLFAYLRHDGDYRAAFNELAADDTVQAAIATGAAAPVAKIAVPLKSDAHAQSLPREIYEKGVGLDGMPAAAYLASRGLHPTDAWEGLRASVRHYPTVGACPVLIAPIDALDGPLAGIQLTYLQPSGHKLAVPDPRRSFGQVRGHAIRLGQAVDELVICEGLEDGLTLFQRFESPVWVACGAGSLHNMIIPQTVRRLMICADNDPAGEQAAMRAADAFMVGGREVRILRPAPGFKDFNDELRGIKS